MQVVIILTHSIVITLL